MTQEMVEHLPADTLRELWAGLLQKSGNLVGCETTNVRENSGGFSVRLSCEFRRYGRDFSLFVDRHRKIDSFYIKPAYKAPGYADPKSFTEVEVTVGSGKFALPGTLSIPNGKGSFPAIVLVHGSGNNDRDETVGQNKPFKDLAWGLASKGVAVLRYEKRSRAHPEKYASLKAPTIEDETINDALLAVEVLINNEHIDNNRIFVLGHSLGARFTPAIGMKDPRIAGLVAMGGRSTMSFAELLPYQERYLSELDGKLTKSERADIKWIDGEAAKLKKLKEGDYPPDHRIMGFPVSYLLSLRKLSPTVTVPKMTQPILILHGKRDYQVPLKNFKGWKKILAGRKNTKFVLYDKLNHLFLEGKGKRTPDEYDKPSNIPEYVISDIAVWIKS